MRLIDPTTIVRGERQRKDLGDLGPLMRSIAATGQINPVIIDDNDPPNLIAGERRTEACTRLGIQVLVRPLSSLDPHTRHIIELEENVKRKDLSWQEQVQAIADYHTLRLEEGERFYEATAKELSISESSVSLALRLVRYKSDERVWTASTLSAANGIIDRMEQRRLDDELSRIDSIFTEEEDAVREIPAASDGAGEETPLADASAAPAAPTGGSRHPGGRQLDADRPILTTTFESWLEGFDGARFNLAHLDFPYGISHDSSEQGGAHAWGSYADGKEVYEGLVERFLAEATRILTPSCHVICWLSFDNYYEWTRNQFAAAGFDYRGMLYWHKTDNRGIVSDRTRRPRNIVETAILFSRGDRKIIQAVGNAYGAPSTKTIHQSEKSEAMLHHFFRMVVDQYTEMLDPTCGSGSALRAAHRLKAARIVGLEANADYAAAANQAFEDAARKARLAEKMEQS